MREFRWVLFCEDPMWGIEWLPAKRIGDAWYVTGRGWHCKQEHILKVGPRIEAPDEPDT